MGNDRTSVDVAHVMVDYCHNIKPYNALVGAAVNRDAIYTSDGCERFNLSCETSFNIHKFQDWGSNLTHKHSC